MNYLQGLPHFAVCVGYRSRDQYRVGVVYDPCRDELFQATLGTGARLNGYPIVIQQVSEVVLTEAGGILTSARHDPRGWRAGTAAGG